MRQLIVIFAFTMLLGSCSKVPVTGRKQFRMLPESMVLSMSLTTYNQFLAANPPVNSTDAQAQQVLKVGTKLKVAVINYMKAHGFSKRLKQFKWEFHLVNDPTVNAWCLPGGKIVVYSGILPLTQDDAGLATVLSHEIAHAVARHGNERMSQQLLIAMGGISLAVAMRDKPEQTQAIFLSVYGIGGTLGALAYSRQHEYEADKIGMVFMAQAGYNPEESIKFWERMSKQGGASPPQFLSTHPSDENRIKAMREFLPTAMNFYKPVL